VLLVRSGSDCRAYLTPEQMPYVKAKQDSCPLAAESRNSPQMQVPLRARIWATAQARP
jgi:hypothetical protein